MIANQKAKSPGALRKALTMLAIVITAAVVALALAFIWAFAIEPELLTVTNIELADARLPEAMDGTRAVFFSDLHVGALYSQDDAARVAKKISELNPDIVLFGGDWTQFEQAENRPDITRVAEAFAGIRAKYGKYAVYGNHDLWPDEVLSDAASMLKGGGFTVLENQAVRIAKGFYVAGTKPWPNHLEEDYENPKDETGLTWAAKNGEFALLLAHEPAQIDDLSKYPFALQLSGHTHGGQVALPFIGPLASTYASGDYLTGRFRVNDTALYVSRGVGVIDLHVRFFSPPEIVVVTLRHIR